MNCKVCHRIPPKIIRDSVYKVCEDSEITRKEKHILFKKPKLTVEQLDKIGSTIEEIKECPFCNYQKQEIKKCLEKHNVKDSLKSVTWHNIKCESCRSRILAITECKKKGHKE